MTTRTVQRFDYAPLTPSVEKTEEGYMIVKGRFVRPGVMMYLDEKGKIFRELVTDETIAGIGTLTHKPLTLGHPKEPVGPDNIHHYDVGDVTEAVVDAEGYGACKVVIKRADALKAVGKGTVQLSPGYVVELDMTPGTHPVHGRYDAVQKTRRYNHLAIVERARGGDACVLRMDEDDVGALAQTAATVAELVEILACDAAGIVNKVRGMLSVPADAAKEDTMDPVEYYKRRVNLDNLAKAFKVDASDDLDKTTKAICLAANPKLKQDGDAAYYDMALTFVTVPAEVPAAEAKPKADPWKADANTTIVNDGTKVHPAIARLRADGAK